MHGKKKTNKQPEVDLERAWKDKAYRQSLTPQQLAQLPPNPGGDMELDDEALNEVTGGSMGATQTAYKSTCPQTA